MVELTRSYMERASCALWFAFLFCTNNLDSSYTLHMPPHINRALQQYRS